MTTSKLHLDVLPISQRRLWDELIDIPGAFVLYGGTAIALYLGHRESVDFDFFGSETFDPDDLYRTVPFLADSEVIQKSGNTLTCLVDRCGTVQVSFFGVPDIVQIEKPLTADDNGLKIASLVDLAGMKVSVVQKRAEAKDYIDIDAIIRDGVIDLPLALAAGQWIYGGSFNPEITLKALSFFGDGNLNTLPQDVRDRLAQVVRAVDLDRLPAIEQKSGSRLLG
jgi:Nucleotidyl transferase AbiEii toxin, Type IV TA system